MLVLKKYVILKYSGSYRNGMAIVTEKQRDAFIASRSKDFDRFEVVAKFTSTSRLKTPISQQFIE